MKRKLLIGTRKSFPYQSRKELIFYSLFSPSRSALGENFFQVKTILLWKHNRKYLVTCTQKTFNALFHPRLAKCRAFILCLNSICTWMKSYGNLESIKKLNYRCSLLFCMFCDNNNIISFPCCRLYQIGVMAGRCVDWIMTAIINNIMFLSNLTRLECYSCTA